MTASPVNTTTDLHAVIAALRTERDAALSEKAALAGALATRNSEYGERIEQQSATIDVLKVMSASPGNPLPVFDLIVQRARSFCGADQCTVALLDGDMLHLKAEAGMNAVSARNYAAQFPRPVNTESMFGRAILAREAVQTPDVLADPEHFSRTRVGGPDPEFRAIVAVPMLRAGTPIGAIALVRRMPGVYSGIQMELLQTFAEQAVIAITSAETYRALQTRTSDLQETLEYQTATTDLLKVISRSTFNLEPVFQTVAATAVRLCNAEQAGVYLHQNGEYRWVGGYSQLPEYERIEREVRIRPGTGTLVGRVALEGRPVHILDALSDTLYEAKEDARVGGIHTLLGVPLLRDGTPIGVIGLGRQKIEPFAERQIELVSTFGSQAVIAMENARLLTEQREALEQQTATAEVLQVINSSPGDLTPVFDAMLEKAIRLCRGDRGVLWTIDGGRGRIAAARGLPAEFVALLRERGESGTNSPLQRVVQGEWLIEYPDTVEEFSRSGDPHAKGAVEAGVRSAIWVAIVKEGVAVGAFAIGRSVIGTFSEKQIALLQNFAAQAVIAMENARLLTETREALEQQTATAEVLQVINSSPGDLTPVFDAMLQRATRLCGTAIGSFWSYNGEVFQVLASTIGDTGRTMQPSTGTALWRIAHGESVVQIADVEAELAYRVDAVGQMRTRLAGTRTALVVALRKDETLVGAITTGRPEVRPFTDKQIALLQNFAAQAVIAMENARLISEQREALEQQTATAEVLQVINASPGNLAPVFDAMLERAMRLCGIAFGMMTTFDGERFRPVCWRGLPTALSKYFAEGGGPSGSSGMHAQLVGGAPLAYVADMKDEEAYRSGYPARRALVDLGGARTGLAIALRKEGVLLGTFMLYRQEVRTFSDKEIALLQSFAAQAVIAMENARLLNEVRQRQEELRITFENMGDGVAMFDETQHLVAWNRKFQEIFDLPDALLEPHHTYEEYLRFLAARGDFGPGVDTVEQITELVASTGQPYGYERTRPDGRVIETRRNPVPDGGFVFIYSDITERKRSEEEIRAARDAAETALRELKTAQANLIQAEKMASLGQLTAGIAHEIKNPLNFVNNFAELSGDLLDELNDAVAGKRQAEIDELTATLQGNLAKITEHGKRADDIVKAMLEHSRGSSGERRMVDLNALIDEALNLAYHGARAQDQSFNITLERDFGASIAPIEVNPQDITRVFLNLFSNGFYATTRRAREGGDVGLVPTLTVTTRDAGEAVDIRVRDNGTGIPADITDKLFQPFFTTKPSGEGTGLGLSISYDIVTQQHGGSITVVSKVGDYSEFTVRLPRNP